MSAAASAWALEVRAGSPTAKLVLLVLADRHNKDTGKCCPSIALLAKDSELSESTVKKSLRDLEGLGIITRERRQRENGSDMTNQFVLHMPPGGRETTPPPAPAAPLEPELEPELEPKDLPPLTPPPSQAITTAWKRSSPPLIEHRPAYFQADATRRAIARALQVYPPDAVADAIRNYATVLASPEYRWEHRWTIVDFLKRGLDRFVPEARPLENFRVKGEKYGRRDVSSAELYALADRLKAERLEAEGRLALESG